MLILRRFSDVRLEMLPVFMTRILEGVEWNIMITLWSAVDWQEKT